MILDLDMDSKLECALISSLWDKDYQLYFSKDQVLKSDKTLNIVDKEWESFVEERTQEVTTDNFLSLPFYEHEPIHWYTVKNKSELIKIIEEKGLCYSFLLVPNGSSVRDYSVEIFVTEHHIYQNKETRAMLLFTRLDTYSLGDKMYKVQEVVTVYNNAQE